MTLKSTNPSNYQCLGEVEVSALDDVERTARLANTAKRGWRNTSVTDRVELLRRVYDRFRGRRQELAELESREMGMPLRDALDDFDDTMDYVCWYFENAERYLSPEVTHEADGLIHRVYREPVGVVAAIVPWNFPFSMFVWATLQGMIAGNVVVLKHSEECPLVGKFIEDVFTSCDLPEGVFGEVYGDREVGKWLAHQEIDMIQFTGSTATGRYLYRVAGERFLRANMELGGSAPGVLFEDVELERTMASVCGSRLFNAGQCCDGLKRLVVHESIVDRVQGRLAELFSQKRLGDALDGATEMGPLVSKGQLARLERQVLDAVGKGARVLAGGKSLESELGGAFYQPTLLCNISEDMRVWQEEVFGPVLPVVSFSTEEEAVALANDTQYGLGAYVFTEDPARARRIALAIDSGLVGVNGCSYFAPSSPFGGWKGSGFGREHSKYGFHEVTQTKVVATKE